MTGNPQLESGPSPWSLRGFALAIAVAPCLWLFAPVADAGARHARCQPKGKVVAANATAIVWRRGSRDSHTTYLCTWRTGRTRSLGNFDTYSFGTYSFRLAGRYLAYEDTACERLTGCEAIITIRNVVTWRALRRSRDLDASGLLSDFVLKRNGSAAWIRRTPDGGGELRRLDAAGEVVLDAGPGVALGSLALAGSTLYWTSSGAARSAPIE